MIGRDTAALDRRFRLLGRSEGRRSKSSSSESESGTTLATRSSSCWDALRTCRMTVARSTSGPVAAVAEGATGAPVSIDSTPPLTAACGATPIDANVSVDSLLSRLRPAPPERAMAALCMISSALRRLSRPSAMTADSGQMHTGCSRRASGVCSCCQGGRGPARACAHVVPEQMQLVALGLHRNQLHARVCIRTGHTMPMSLNRHRRHIRSSLTSSLVAASSASRFSAHTALTALSRAVRELISGETAGFASKLRREAAIPQ